MNGTILGTKMQESIARHIQVQDWSLSLPLRALLSFFIMLVILWCIALMIGIGFQVKYHFDRQKEQQQIIATTEMIPHHHHHQYEHKY
jgi:hypothetical protein